MLSADYFTKFMKTKSNKGEGLNHQGEFVKLKEHFCTHKTESQPHTQIINFLCSCERPARLASHGRRGTVL